MSKGYRRVELHAETTTTSRPAPTGAAVIHPLRIALAVAGAVLLVASGVQLVELMAGMPRPTGAAALATSLPRPDVAWTTVAGAVVMPVAAVLCFVAFTAMRARALRS